MHLLGQDPHDHPVSRNAFIGTLIYMLISPVEWTIKMDHDMYQLVLSVLLSSLSWASKPHIIVNGIIIML